MERFQFFHPDDMKPIDRGKGIKSIPLVGSQTGSEILLTGMTIFPPGAAIPLHTHNTDECIVMLEGRAICEVDGQKQEVAPFDTTFAAAGVPHRFINIGDGQMRILWIYGRTDTTRTFVETGETMGHLDQYKAPAPKSL
jgi:putative monooxygenase